LQLTIIAFGKGAGSDEQAICQRYLARLHPPGRLVEIGKGDFPPPPPGSRTVVLDEGGDMLSSLMFARRLERWRDDGVREIRFLVGPADGHRPETLARADLLLAFGPQTWPHLLVRALLAEQLYRAQSILSGHPYHRDG
jgi:23S rRNA (pseudouridine1915-N3)-methyltransferase